MTAIVNEFSPPFNLMKDENSFKTSSRFIFYFSVGYTSHFLVLNIYFNVRNSRVQKFSKKPFFLLYTFYNENATKRRFFND